MSSDPLFDLSIFDCDIILFIEKNLAVIAILSHCLFFGIFACIKHYDRLNHKESLSFEIQKRERAEKLRGEERAGRINAERKLRDLRSNATNQASQSSDNATTNVKNPTWDLQPVSYLQSCFKSKHGTPRQGCLIDIARAKLKIRKEVIEPCGAVDSLENYSHVWVIFIFHENTNAHRETLKAKITPPYLGKKVGVYSTRSPNRPNAVGLSVCKLDKVENGTLFLSGCDLIEGTPILDVKPYIPVWDSLPSAVSPEWIQRRPQTPTFKSVEFSETSLAQLDALLPSLQFYSNEKQAIMELIHDVLILDVRSSHRKKINDEDEIFQVHLDRLDIRWKVVKLHDDHQQVLIDSISRAKKVAPVVKGEEPTPKPLNLHF